MRYNSGDAFDVRVSGTVFEKGTTTRTEIRYRTTFFRVEPLPRITSLSPSSGKRGAILTITGRSFDSKRGENIVRFGESACTKYVSWSDTRIRVKVPATAAFGSVRVFVQAKAGESNGRPFRVKHQLAR